MLHIINKLQALTNCLPYILPGDAIVLIEDSVYAAVSKIELNPKEYSIFALKNDLVIRGITDKILSDIKVITYEEFVELTLRFYPSQTW